MLKRFECCEVIVLLIDMVGYSCMMVYDFDVMVEVCWYCEQIMCEIVVV